MSDLHKLAERLEQIARRVAAGVRPWHLGVAALVVLAGAGIALARSLSLPEPEPGGIRDGERMQIQVVAPVEPEITPGSVMEVGDLVEGFEYRRPEPDPIKVVDEMPDDLEAEPPVSRPPVRHREDPGKGYDKPLPDRPVERREERGGDRSFGFDAPERDYRAEREARRARMEQDRGGREVRWYHSDGRPVDGRASGPGSDPR